MGREYQDYRPYRELISEMFPGRMEVKVTELAPALGIAPRTAYDRYGGIIYNGAIGVVQLARAMCDEEKKKRRKSKKCLRKR